MRKMQPRRETEGQTGYVIVYEYIYYKSEGFVYTKAEWVYEVALRNLPGGRGLGQVGESCRLRVVFFKMLLVLFVFFIKMTITWIRKKVNITFLPNKTKNISPSPALSVILKKGRQKRNQLDN